MMCKIENEKGAIIKKTDRPLLRQSWHMPIPPCKTQQRQESHTLDTSHSTKSFNAAVSSIKY